MSRNFYGATGLIGGTDGKLDNIDGAALVDGDGAIVITASNTYTYILDDDSAAGEDSPAIIEPDANGGDKRWILVGVTTAGVTMLDGGTIGQAAGPLLTFDDDNNYLLITGCDVGFGTATPDSPVMIERDQSRTVKTGTAFGLVHLDGGQANDDLTTITLAESNGVPVSIIGASTSTVTGSNLFFGTSATYVSGVTQIGLTINAFGHCGFLNPVPESLITGGANSTIQGVLRLWDGGGGNTPGHIIVGSPNGTLWYLFVEDDGTVKVHNAAPTQNADGNAVGEQTDA